MRLFDITNFLTLFNYYQNSGYAYRITLTLPLPLSKINGLKNVSKIGEKCLKLTLITSYGKGLLKMSRYYNFHLSCYVVRN